MDDKRFDALTRALAGGMSRRNVLKGLLGGAGALAGSAVVKQQTSAQTCPTPAEDVCTGDTGSNPNGCPCNGGAGTCVGGFCCGRPCGATGCCAGNPDCEVCSDLGTCDLVNQGGACNGGAGVCEGQWCVDPPTTTSDPCASTNGICLNGEGGNTPDGCACNGGAGTCVGGWCCGRPCGATGCCAGNPDCEVCSDLGTCDLVNQGGACNGGAGVCEGEWCVDPPTTTPEPTTTTAAPLYDLPIFKSDGSQLIDGACFTLYSGACGPTGSAVRSEQCVAAIGTGGGADGRTIFEDLPAGTYCVVESTVPTGYDGGGPVTVNLPENSTGWTVINLLQPTTTTTEPICLENEAYCYDDDECCTGCCTENEAIGELPNRYCHPAEYCETCGTFGDSCGDSPDILAAAGARQLDCCDGLLCCHGEGYSTTDDDDFGPAGESMYCAQCCNDHHCGKGYHCCHGQCISDDYCCSDYDCGDCEECYFINGYGFGYCEPTGVPFGEYCGYVITSEGGSPQLDCCDGLVCCDVDKDGNRCFECCGDWDCPKGSECKHGVCEHECKHDKECPDGTCCCKSGHCSKHCCKDKPHKHGKKPHDKDDKGGTHVDTLPSTGSGDTAAGAGWLGAAALGAAAYVVGKTVRDSGTPEAEAQPEE